MRNLFYILIFILLTCILFYKIDRVIVDKGSILGNRFDYYQECNLYDVLFLGPSTTYDAINPTEIWNMFGVSSFNRAHPAQNYKKTYYLLHESLSLHKPKLVIYDVGATISNLQFSRDQIQEMSLSYSKYLGIRDAYNNTDIINNMFAYNKYHQRWKNLTYMDFIQPKNQFKGYNTDVSIFWVSPQKKIYYPYNPTKKLDEEGLKYINNIVELCKKNNVPVLFITYPSNYYEDKSMIFDSFEKYAQEHNIEYINLNKYIKDIDFDFSKNLKVSFHSNYYGGIKIIKFLIPYIINKYNVPIRKNDPEYNFWNSALPLYSRELNKAQLLSERNIDDKSPSITFSEWQNLAYYDNYTILISTNGDNVLNRLPQSMKDKFKSLGLNKFETNKKNQKYAAIIDNNNVFFEEVSDRKVEYKGRMKNIVNLLISSEHNKATINVSGKPRAKNKYGINFVIYDKVNREIVDSIWVDPAKPDEVRR